MARDKTSARQKSRQTDHDISPLQLARMGGGHLAYIRPIRVEEAMRILGAPIQAPPGAKLYGVFHADGQPLAITDSRAGALANALEHDLEPASVH